LRFTNEAGVIEVAENMDIYDYDRFDWVLRLYDEMEPSCVHGAFR